MKNVRKIIDTTVSGDVGSLSGQGQTADEEVLLKQLDDDRIYIQYRCHLTTFLLFQYFQDMPICYFKKLFFYSCLPSLGHRFKCFFYRLPPILFHESI